MPLNIEIVGQFILPDRLNFLSIRAPSLICKLFIDIYMIYII